jgi:hypothetical protein
VTEKRDYATQAMAEGGRKVKSEKRKEKSEKFKL